MKNIRVLMGLDARKTVFWGLWTTEAQTSLRIRAIWPIRICYSFFESIISRLATYEISIFLASLCSWAD